MFDNVPSPFGHCLISPETEQAVVRAINHPPGAVDVLRLYGRRVDTDTILGITRWRDFRHRGPGDTQPGPRKIVPVAVFLYQPVAVGASLQHIVSVGNVSNIDPLAVKRSAI